MTQTATVNSGLTEFRDLDALLQAKVAYSGLLNNTYFPTPDVPMPKFLAAITDFDAKMVAAHKTIGAPKVAKNAARILLNEIYSAEVMVI